MTGESIVARRSRAGLHLLWTIPLATVLALPVYAWGAISLCGISGCTGGGFGPDYDYQAQSWLCCVVIGLLYFLGLVFVPWLRRWPPRLILSAAIGSLIGGLVALYFLSALR